MKLSQMLWKDVVCTVSITESSMLLVSMMSGFKTNMISGGLGLVSGSITISIHLWGTTTGWKSGGQTRTLVLLLVITLRWCEPMVMHQLYWSLSSWYPSKYFTAIPLTTQSDPGSENYGVANVHTLACHELDLMLSGTLQHHWKRQKNNVKSEANWSVFHQDFAPGFEDLFESGVNQGWYSVDKPLEK